MINNIINNKDNKVVVYGSYTIKVCILCSLIAAICRSIGFNVPMSYIVMPLFTPFLLICGALFFSYCMTLIYFLYSMVNAVINFAETGKLHDTVSAIGVNWAQSNKTEDYWPALAYGNNMFVAGSFGLWYSYDGKNWIQSNKTDGIWYALAYGNNMFVAGSSGDGLWQSTDGIHWTQSNKIDGYWNALAYGNNMFIAGSDTGLWYSYDGKNWIQSNKTDGRWLALAYGNNMFIAGSDGNGILYSTDVN